MEARFKGIRNLFGKRGVKFNVPPYQRGYEWDEKHFEDLWLDLNRIGERVRQHYLGSIILLEKSEGKEYEIVDGQQRMMTISILMMALRDSPNIHDEGDRRIDDIINTYPANKAERKLYPNDNSTEESFTHIWQGDIEKAEGNVKQAYDFYYKRVENLSESEIDILLDKVVNDLKVVETIAKETSIAYMVFQSQNERGKNVEPHILAKARIHGAAEELDNKAEKKEVIGRWDEIYNQLERELGRPRFGKDLRVRRPLTQILINIDESNPPRIDKEALYRNFDETLQRYDGVLEFVEEFDNQIGTYLEISSSNYDVSGRGLPDEAVRHLQYMNSATTHSEVLSLSICNNVEDEVLLEEYLRLASILAMRMEIGGASSSAKRDAIYDVSKKVRREDNVNDIRAVLKDSISNKTPTDAEILEFLKANSLTIRGIWQFRTLLILVSIEEGRRGPVKLDMDNIEIEHVAPRASFSNSKYSMWRRKLNEEGYEEQRDKLGNLTLLLPEDHSSLDETSFSSKKNTYKNSDIRIAEEIAEYNEWTDKEIENRTKRLAKELIDRWSV